MTGQGNNKNKKGGRRGNLYELSIKKRKNQVKSEEKVPQKEEQPQEEDQPHEEEEPQEDEGVKHIYFSITRRMMFTRWYVIKPTAGDEQPTISEASGLLNECSKQAFKDFTCAVWKSKIYILGGLNPPVSLDLNPSPHNKVFVYDVASDTVESLPGMSAARAGHVAVVINEKIYVFGSQRFRSNDTTFGIEHWAEFYNPASQKWDSLPPPPEPVYECGYFDALVVDKCRTTIYLLKCDERVSSYNYSKKTWKAKDLDGIILTLPWSNNYAIAHNVFFWYFRGEIYAYDLIHHTMFQHPLKFPHTTAPTTEVVHMVYLGDGSFCLVYLDTKFYLNCYGFQIKRGGESLDTEVAQGVTFYLGTKIRAIKHVVTL